METQKMLVAEALDERDFLRKKITERISNLDVSTVVRASDKTTNNGIEISKYNEDAKANVQSIKDLIARYNAINLALAKSNTTETVTVGGKTMTRAEAITLRKDHVSGCELTESLNKKLINQINIAQVAFSKYKRQYEMSREKYIDSLLSSEGVKELSEDKLNAVDSITKGDVPVLLDPLSLASTLDTYVEDQERFYKELETAIKVSNASTTIEI